MEDETKMKITIFCIIYTLLFGGFHPTLILQILPPTLILQILPPTLILQILPLIILYSVSISTLCMCKKVDNIKLYYIMCDAPIPGGPLTTRQPAEYLWMSGNPTPFMKIRQSLLCTGSSTQGTTCPNHMATCPNILQRPHRIHIQLK